MLLFKLFTKEGNLFQKTDENMQSRSKPLKKFVGAGGVDLNLITGNPIKHLSESFKSPM